MTPDATRRFEKCETTTLFFSTIHSFLFIHFFVGSTFTYVSNSRTHTNNDHDVHAKKIMETKDTTIIMIIIFKIK